MIIPIESALVVFFPQVESLVESFRQRFDPFAALGVPAHVTVLYPFKPPAEVTLQDQQKLVDLFMDFPAFTITFAETRCFPDVLYLAPYPDEPFRRLTKAVARKFPKTPPYGGEYSDVIPHLTVAQTTDSGHLEKIASEFQQAAKEVLPIQADVREVSLMDNANGAWQVRYRFKLNTGSKTS